MFPPDGDSLTTSVRFAQQSPDVLRRTPGLREFVLDGEAEDGVEKICFVNFSKAIFDCSCENYESESWVTGRALEPRLKVKALTSPSSSSAMNNSIIRPKEPLDYFLSVGIFASKAIIMARRLQVEVAINNEIQRQKEQTPGKVHIPTWGAMMASLAETLRLSGNKLHGDSGYILYLRDIANFLSPLKESQQATFATMIEQLPAIDTEHEPSTDNDVELFPGLSVEPQADFFFSLAQALDTAARCIGSQSEPAHNAVEEIRKFRDAAHGAYVLAMREAGKQRVRMDTVDQCEETEFLILLGN